MVYVFILHSRIEEEQFAIPSIQELRQYQIVVATQTTSMALALMGLPKGHFTHIFIDDATQVGPSSLYATVHFVFTFLRPSLPPLSLLLF